MRSMLPLLLPLLLAPVVLPLLPLLPPVVPLPAGGEVLLLLRKTMEITTHLRRAMNTFGD